MDKRKVLVICLLDEEDTCRIEYIYMQMSVLVALQIRCVIALPMQCHMLYKILNGVFVATVR